MDSSTCCTICSYRREERTTLYMTSSPTRIRTIPHSGTTAVPLRTQLSTAFDEGLVSFWSSCWTNLPRSPCFLQPLYGASSIHTVLMFVNSRMPCAPNSRPCPDHFTPPKGIRGSEATIRFMKTIPDSRSLMKRSRSFLSFVQALAPNSNRVLQILRPEHARHGTEQLFLVRRRTVRNIC